MLVALQNLVVLEGMPEDFGALLICLPPVRVAEGFWKITAGL